jgi:hypothetical protein
MSDSHGINEERLLRKLQQLVGILGLNCGQLTIEVHQGAVRVMDIKQHLRVLVGPDSSGDPELADEELILLRAAERFVRDHLEPVIVSQVGDYGRLVVEVKDGIVEKFDLVRKFKNKKCRSGSKLSSHRGRAGPGQAAAGG